MRWSVNLFIQYIGNDVVVVLGVAELVALGAADLVVVHGAAKPAVVHGTADFMVVLRTALLKGFRMARHVLEL